MAVKCAEKARPPPHGRLLRLPAEAHMRACLLAAQPTCVLEITDQVTGVEPGRSPSALPGCVPMLSVVVVSEPSLSHL